MTPEEFLGWATRFPDALMLVSSDSRIVAGNPALAQLLSRPQDDLVGRQLDEVLNSTPEKTRAALRLWSSSAQMIYGPLLIELENGEKLRCEGAAVRSSGEGRLRGILVRVKRQQEAASRFLLLNRKVEELKKEIRARQRSEQKVREHREWLRVTLSSIGDAVIATDTDGKIEFMNGIAEYLTGWPAEEAHGRAMGEVFQILNEHTREMVDNPTDRVLRDGVRVGLANHTILRARNGVERPIDDSAAPIHGADGSIVGAVLVFHDVTDRRISQAALERAHEEALAASKAKDEFLAALSHELRTPLNPVLLLAGEGARNDKLPERVRRDFATIAKSAMLEARLIDDLLNLTRMNRSELSIETKKIDLHAVLEGAVATVQTEIESKALSLEQSFGASRHGIIGDAARLQQVFLNILQNAVKFTPQGGTIWVCTDDPPDGSELIVKIADSGSGMTSAELHQAFDPFAQGELARNRGHFGGLGLGLAVSRQLIEQHGGSIEAASDGRAKGSTLTIKLPIAVEEIKSGEAEDGEAESASDVSLHAGQRILLVEDHDTTRIVLGELLNAKGCDVVAAASVAEAIDAASAGQFDLLISDLGLPDGDGYGLMRELGGKYGLSGIAVSGYGTEEDIARSHAAGFTTHLVKPISMQALEDALAHPKFRSISG